MTSFFRCRMGLSRRHSACAGFAGATDVDLVAIDPSLAVKAKRTGPQSTFHAADVSFPGFGSIGNC